jgi:hypothetical protein
MKTWKISKNLLLGMALLLASSAFAAEKGALKVFDPVSVAGKQLKPGNYTVEWTGSGPNVEMSILSGRSVVATAPAHLVDRQRAATSNATTTRSNADGSVTLSAIEFQGKKYALEIGGEPQTAAASDTK